MAVHLSPLLKQAFFKSEPQPPEVVLDQARKSYCRERNREGTSLEVNVPEKPDEAWLADVLSRLIFQVETTGGCIPDCPGMFVALLTPDRLYCVDADKVMQFVEQAFNADADAMQQRYSPQELYATPRHA